MAYIPLLLELTSGNAQEGALPLFLPFPLVVGGFVAFDLDVVASSFMVIPLPS